MLNKDLFQEKSKLFCSDFGKDYGEWTLVLMYQRLNYLKSEQLIEVFERCLLQRETNLLPVPSKVLEMAEGLFPRAESALVKQKVKKLEIEENKRPKVECKFCNQTGKISARERRQLNNLPFKTEYEKIFRCFCPNGEKLVDYQRWGRGQLKDYEPEYEKYLNKPQIESINEILPGMPQVNKQIKSKVLGEELFQHINKQFVQIS